MRNCILFLSKILQKSFLLPILVIFLIGCQPRGQEEAVTTLNKGKGGGRSVKSFDRQEVPQGLLTLSAQAQKGEAHKTQVPKENLYGKFFDERAAFYIIEEPQNKLFQAKVKSLTLYYLDGQLSQTRYIVEQDIVDSLLKMYGSFGIIGHDPKNQELIRSRQIMLSTADGLVFNKALDNYQLVWQVEDQQIRYRVNIHTLNEQFKYVERTKAYKQTLNEIERTAM